MSRYLPESTKTGDLNLWRTVSGSFFVILEHLVSIHAVVLAFTANKQIRKTNTLNYIYRYIYKSVWCACRGECVCCVCVCMWGCTASMCVCVCVSMRGSTHACQHDSVRKMPLMYQSLTASPTSTLCSVLTCLSSQVKKRRSSAPCRNSLLCKEVHT